MNQSSHDAARQVSELYKGKRGVDVSVTTESGDEYRGMVTDFDSYTLDDGTMRREVEVEVETDEYVFANLTVLDDGHGPFEPTIELSDGDEYTQSKIVESVDGQ